MITDLYIFVMFSIVNKYHLIYDHVNRTVLLTVSNYLEKMVKRVCTAVSSLVSS